MSGFLALSLLLTAACGQHLGFHGEGGPPASFEADQVQTALPQHSEFVDPKDPTRKFVVNVNEPEEDYPTSTHKDVVGTDWKSHEKSAGQPEMATVITSWVLFHMPGNHTAALTQPALPQLVSGLRNALADALMLCRPSVGIIDMRAVNIEVIEPRPWGKEESFGASMLERTKRVMRLDQEEHHKDARQRLNGEARTGDRINVTQVKAAYEVRIFSEMRSKTAEVAVRVDKLQLYTHFSELNRHLGHSLASMDKYPLENVMLDDIGYAARHELKRPPIVFDSAADCVEEGLLADSRIIHQYVMAFSLTLVGLTTCAGSTVFTIKHASGVPSRLNPLVPSGNL